MLLLRSTTNELMNCSSKLQQLRTSSISTAKFFSDNKVLLQIWQMAKKVLLRHKTRIPYICQHPLVLSSSDDTDISTTSATSSNLTTNFHERRGVIHLFRSVSNPSSRSTLLFVVAVPNYMSSGEFIRFCGSFIDSISELIIIRNDGMEDRYSVLICLISQLKADGFYCTFNGKKFSPTEAEVCHILFTLSVDYTESAESASIHPPGYIELPTCPVCLERLDQDTSGILSTLCDHSFQCSCISKWTYLSCQVSKYMVSISTAKFFSDNKVLLRHKTRI